MYNKSKPIPIVSSYPTFKKEDISKEVVERKCKSWHDDFWMNSPSDEVKEEKREILQLYHFQSACKAAQPKLSQLVQIQQEENVKDKCEEITDALERRAKLGKNYVIIKFYNPAVSIDISKIFKTRGYCVVNLPCKMTDVARFYIAHLMIDDRPIKIVEK